MKHAIDAMAAGVAPQLAADDRLGTMA